jgi:4'-phosphopantetheinyl transferase EntD
MLEKSIYLKNLNIHLVHTKDVDIVRDEDFLKSTLSAEEIATYAQISHNKRKIEFAAVRYLLHRQSLKGTLFYGADGVPFLKNECHISISHSGAWVGIALCDSHRVGFDLEFIRPKVQRVYDKFVHLKEFELFPKTQVHLCTLLWSFKETVYKLMRTPGLRFAEDIIVQKNENGDFFARVLKESQIFHVPLGFEIIDDCVMTYNAANVQQIQ